MVRKFKRFCASVPMSAKVATGALVALSMSALPAFADGGTADSGVTGAMTTIASNSQATIEAVGAIAIVIFGVFLAWKYGRKLFSQVAK